MAYLHTSVRFKCCSYLCMPVSSCVCVCIYISISARFCKIFCSFCLVLFAPAFRVCRALWLLLHPLVPAIPLLVNELTLFALRVFLIQILCVVCVVLSHCTSATTDEPRKLANPSTPFAASAPSFTFVAQGERGGKWGRRHLVNKRI